MKYNFEKSYDQQKALEYLNKLIEDGSKATLTKLYPKRSISQNSYLHVLFTLWGNEFGYTLDEAKDLVKVELKYTYKKRLSYGAFNDEYDTGSFMVKTSEMDSKELTIFIDKFRNWSADTCGLYLPSSEEFLSEQIYFENQIEQSI